MSDGGAGEPGPGEVADGRVLTPWPPEREQGPLGVTLGPTGEPAVDAVLERLADADALPTGGHAEVYEDVHRGLRDALTALDTPPGPRPPMPPG